ncbi:DUF2277 family protein [Micromonospora sp. NPDC005686]
MESIGSNEEETPAAHDAAAFEAAVDAVAAATATLLDHLVVRGQQPAAQG